MHLQLQCNIPAMEAPVGTCQVQRPMKGGRRLGEQSRLRDQDSSIIMSPQDK